MTMTVPLAPGGHWTIADLARLPDDGNRYEIFDGSLLVTPPPAIAHVVVQGRLTALLSAHAPKHLLALDGGAGVNVRDGASYYVPDIVVIHADAPGGNGYALDAVDVVLAVEVLSPGNRGRDLVLKRHDYAAAGIPDYWIVDREARTLTVLTLDKGATVYREDVIVRAGTPWQASRPFEITLDPATFC